MQGLGIEILFEGNHFIRLLAGLWVTFRIALIAVAISVVLGFAFGLVMTRKNPVIRWISKIYLEFIRIMPQFVLLFIFYFGIAKAFSINLSGELSAIIVFSFWGIAEMGDLVREALISTPKIQYESGRAIGLNTVQVYWYVIFPQAIKRLIPNTINLTTRIIKTTSLVALIGVIEVLKTAQQIIEASRFDYPQAAIWLYAVVFLLYFIICYPISLVSKRLEKRWKS